MLASVKRSFWHIPQCRDRNLNTPAIVNDFSVRLAQWYSAGALAGWSEFRVPAEAGNPSLHHRVQTGSTASPPSQLPIQWVIGALSLGVKRPGLEADHSSPSSVEVKNAWSDTASPQYGSMAWCLVKHRDSFTFAFKIGRWPWMCIGVERVIDGLWYMFFWDHVTTLGWRDWIKPRKCKSFNLSGLYTTVHVLPSNNVTKEHTARTLFEVMLLFIYIYIYIYIYNFHIPYSDKMLYGDQPIFHKTSQKNAMPWA
jgi:hypothetical protein